MPLRGFRQECHSVHRGAWDILNVLLHRLSSIMETDANSDVGDSGFRFWGVFVV